MDFAKLKKKCIKTSSTTVYVVMFVYSKIILFSQFPCVTALHEESTRVEGYRVVYQALASRMRTRPHFPSIYYKHKFLLNKYFALNYFNCSSASDCWNIIFAVIFLSRNCLCY